MDPSSSATSGEASLTGNKLRTPLNGNNADININGGSGNDALDWANSHDILMAVAAQTC